MTKKEKLFMDFLWLTEFELVKHDDGYGLLDMQGANLGDIEGDRFFDGAQIIDRMGIYINDYILRDLEDGLPEVNASTCEGWLEFWNKHHSERGVREYADAFAFIRMIVHPNGINLCRCFKGA